MSYPNFYGNNNNQVTYPNQAGQNFHFYNGVNLYNICSASAPATVTSTVSTSSQTKRNTVATGYKRTNNGKRGGSAFKNGGACKGFKNRDKYIHFQDGKKFLHFKLTNSPYGMVGFKINDTDRANFKKLADAVNGAFFDNFCKIDGWGLTPDQKLIEETAKYAVFVGHKLGENGVTTIVEILHCRMTGSLNFPNRMILLYLIHVIMAVETVNYDMRSGGGSTRPYCIKFEDMLLNEQRNVFRRLVLAAPYVEQRQELYSLRCKWVAFFSSKGLKAVDRLDFWVQESRLPPISVPLPPSATQTSQNNFTGNVNASKNIPGNIVTNQNSFRPGNTFTSGNNVIPQIHRNYVASNINITGNTSTSNNYLTGNVILSPNNVAGITIPPTPPTSPLSMPICTKNAVNCSKNGVTPQTLEDIQLNTLNPIIEFFLSLDWLNNFPLTKEDKIRLTDKYSVNKPSGKDVVEFCNKTVEFCMAKIKSRINLSVLSSDKDRFIDAAKEVIYVQNVFGKKEISAVSEVLISKLAPSPERKTTKVERLKSLLLVHIILYAEATQSSYKHKPKIARPFCNAFSTDALVLSFRKLVAFSSNRDTKQKLYWMRLRWDSCILDEYLYKIDDFCFWGKSGVILCEIPAHLNKRSALIGCEPENDTGEDVTIIALVDKNEKREDVAVILLQSSEDEDSENETRVIVDVLEKNCRKEKELDYVDLFKINRSDMWSAKFFMDAYCISKLRQKYDFSQTCDAIDKSSADELALDLFRKTVLDVFPSVTEPKFLNLAKEAFFIGENFSYRAVNYVTNFLVQIMEEGFNFCNSPDSKLTSRIIAFLLIHIIISIESVEPLIVPDVIERRYVKAIECEKGSLSAATLIKSIKEDKQLRGKLRFLKRTWTVRDESRISVRRSAMYKENYDKEGSYVKNVIEYIKQKYDSNKDIFDKEKSAASERSKRKLEVIEIGSSDDEDRDLGPNSSDSARLGQHKQSRSSKNSGSSSRKSGQTKESSKALKDLEELFGPDVVEPAPPKNQSTENTIEKEKDTSERDMEESAAGVSCSNINSSSVTPGLVGGNDQPLSLESSKAGKAIENLRNLLQERRKKSKKGKEANELVQASPFIKEVQINNFESEDFLDNLLTPTLTDFEIVYNEDGTAQVKFIHAMQ